MVVERKLGTEDDPDIIESGNSIEVIPEKTRQEAIQEAASILVADDQVFTEDELQEEQPPPLGAGPP